MAQRQITLALPKLGTPDHTRYVCRLYKRSIKLAQDWYWQRHEFREKAILIRLAFEENRHETSQKVVDALLLNAEHSLSLYYHPQPYIRMYFFHFYFILFSSFLLSFFLGSFTLFSFHFVLSMMRKLLFKSVSKKKNGINNIYLSFFEIFLMSPKF